MPDCAAPIKPEMTRHGASARLQRAGASPNLASRPLDAPALAAQPPALAAR
jgi:hypothetical protein